ncbi:lipoyl synthase [Pseudobacteriovorax antillogorgiicola]|uniref:Lipoyl synthase n=1 Tax=Pseudobacteriovorax antillogorgiicola TaxID=1513793 RepID=A0A1Y6C6M0_9BACT|nr:lipoyl synthase [Pseudobacteriovorax antillogorgiicola]TCS49433.1 lipoic acid synthetase [Pseudobacteriovorax antillogorgiicola]SMF46672.1 lipoic acid synthetase [Pseudobacteriovorax antillogorgiicola]
MTQKPEAKKDLHVNKPKWLKTKIPTGSTYFDIKRDLRKKQLYTVCEEAKCPNISECWATNTATFMILGDTCTRACRFCNVKTGNPQGWLDDNEPKKTAESVKLMKLRYAVLTMVDRDDLEDGGAAHVARVFDEIRKTSPDCRLEFLGGDFQAKDDSLARILEAMPEVFAHNIETIERLTPRVRDARSTYRRSLAVLKRVKELANYQVFTKSAIMLGLGESKDEVVQSLKDLRDHNVDFITMGQYMRPSKRHLSIKEFVEPEVFEDLKGIAYDLGFLGVASSPLVRSSYRAGDLYDQALESLKQKG